MLTWTSPEPRANESYINNMNKDQAEFDIVVFGATSFVGRILCHYLTNECTEPRLTWAMAARSGARLQALKNSLGPAAQAIPALVADAASESDLESLCQRSRLIISTVGPYALYGEPLVRVCATTGTDYCDLTGEAQWIRRMLVKYQADATASGARIVHCCGFDSIPSDLGVRFLQTRALARFGRYCKRVRMGVQTMRGGASGGTIASGVNLFREAARDPALRAELLDLYSLCPNPHRYSVHPHTVTKEYDADLQSWLGPFIMAAINSRVVLRSNAVLDYRYGTDFLYDEGTLTGDGERGERRAARLARGSRMGTFVMAVAPLRWLALKFLPSPGEGPTPQQQREGCFDLRFVGHTDQGETIRVKVTGDRDPGYGSTARMLAQAGISLLRDVPRPEVGGGFWTPASVFNERLMERLQQHAGMTFEELDGDPPQA